MYQKLFQITLVLFLVVVSIAMLALIVSALWSAISPSPMLARDYGIAIVAGAVDERKLSYMIVAASLVIAGFYLFFRRRRFRR